MISIVEYETLLTVSGTSTVLSMVFNHEYESVPPMMNFEKHCMSKVLSWQKAQINDVLLQLVSPKTGSLLEDPTVDL